MAYRLYIHNRLTIRRPKGVPRPFSAQGASRETSRNTFRSRFWPVEPADAKSPCVGRLRTRMPRSRLAPTVDMGDRGRLRRTNAPAISHTACFFRAPLPASKPQCSRQAIWTPEPVARLSANAADANCTSMAFSPYASTIESSFVAVKLLTTIFDAYQRSAGAVPKICVTANVRFPDENGRKTMAEPTGFSEGAFHPDATGDRRD